MPKFDLFGLGKDPAVPGLGSPGVAPPGSSLTPKKRALAVLVVNVLAALAFASLTASRVAFHIGQSTAVPPPRLPPKRAEPAAQPKAEPPAAESPKPEPPKPEPPRAEPPKALTPTATPKPEPPAAKVPTGSPAVNAPDLPKRTARPASTPKPAADRAIRRGSAASEALGAADRATRPIQFTHHDAGAAEVALIAPFLVRTGGRKEMFRRENGTWQLTVYLKTGATYHYRVEVVDKGGRKTLTPKKSLQVD